MTYRDEELGSALGALRTPDHRPGFFEDLERRLGRETLARPSAPRSRRFASRLLALAATFASVAAVALALGDRVLHLGASDVASAAEIKARVRATLASMETLSGTFVARCTERGCPGKARRLYSVEFLLGAAGDFRLAGPASYEIVTYDASTGVVRSAGPSASIAGDPTIFYAERRGVAPGPPDLGPPGLFQLEDFGAYVRALFAANDPSVREVAYEGRPAWEVETETAPNAIVPEFTGDLFRITVDRRTAMPVRVAELKEGALLREMRVESLRLDAEPGPGAFRLAFPPNAEVLRQDDGFRRVSLNGVAGAGGYAPLVPAWVPDGYDLAEVAVAERAGPTGAEAGNPPSRRVVSLSYRRGFDQFVVTTRLAAGGPWTDPLATGEGYRDEPERVTVDAGALRGVEAELLIVPRGIPHAWALTDDLVVTVAGDLTRAELVRVMASLERRG